MKTKMVKIEDKKYVMKKLGVRELIGIRSRAMNARDRFQPVYYSALLKQGFEKPLKLSDFGWELEQETFEIDEKEYLMQRPDVETVLEIRSRMLQAGELSQLQAYEDYLEYIVVKPNCSIEDFEDDIAHLDRLMRQAEDYMNGHPNLTALDSLMQECEKFLFGGK